MHRPPESSSRRHRRPLGRGPSWRGIAVTIVLLLALLFALAIFVDSRAWPGGIDP